MRERAEGLGRFKSCQGGVAKDQRTEMGTFSSEMGTAARSREQLASPDRDGGKTVHVRGAMQNLLWSGSHKTS